MTLTPKQHRYLAIELNTQVWRLLGQTERTDADDRRMEHFAQGSFFHWNQAEGFTPIHAQRSHWLLARVYTILRRGEDAIHHASTCLQLTDELGVQDFDRAYALEGLARANAALGRMGEAQSFYARALNAAKAISRDQDRTLFQSDLDGGPWFGLQPKADA